jgi:hypothetical protein
MHGPPGMLRRSEGYGASMNQQLRTRLPTPRGPVSHQVAQTLAQTDVGDVPVPPPSGAVLTDGDAQLALWMLYELSYRGFESVADDREWDPDLIRVRRDLEDRFECELREAAAPLVVTVADLDDVGDQILAMAQRAPGVSLSSYLRRDATREQIIDFLRERSVQQLKESDPQSFLLPRLEGSVKVALAEIQYDEYGAGDPARLHQSMFAEALGAAGLDPAYGAYVDDVSAVSLASANVMSLFCLNRRLRGAGVGHFAAFEASSSVPSRRVSAGIARVGLPPATSAYFDEHVEADAVHEQVAARDICGGLTALEPDLHTDVLFGAAAALHLDALSAAELMERWADDNALMEREAAS